MIRAFVFATATVAAFSLVCVPTVSHAAARGPSKDGQKTVTAQEALDEAEHMLDMGSDVSDISAKLHRSRGLTRDEQARLDLIDARCALLIGAYAKSEKVLGRLHQSTPDDARITEWYARALDGTGKGESALPLLKGLAEKDGLKDGDSYWTLAQLEHGKGDDKLALAHAEAALTHPIVLQSDALDKEIHKFISDLSTKKK